MIGKKTSMTFNYEMEKTDDGLELRIPKEFSDTLIKHLKESTEKNPFKKDIKNWTSWLNYAKSMIN